MPSGPRIVSRLILVKRPSLSRCRPRPLAACFLGSVLWLSGCGENIFEQKWTTARVDTVLLYSLAHPDLNRSSAFNFVDRIALEIHAPDATGAWDLLLHTQDGELVFLPPGALGLPAEAMFLSLPGMAFDDVTRAPKDTTLYTKDLPLIVETSSVYVLRTHQGVDRFGLPCRFYGKLQPLEVKVDPGTVRFVYDVSRLCDDRGLVPEDG